MFLLVSFFTASKKRSSYLEYSDEALAALYRENNDMEVISEFHRRYAHLVLGVCLKYLRNEDAACDTTMHIFEKLISDLKTHKVDNFKSWLYSVSKNQCLMEIRKTSSTEKQKEYYIENSTEKFVEIWDELHLNHEYDEEKRVQALTNALQQLNKEQRVCIELFFLKDKSYNEIADLANMDVKNVKSHIQNGKRNLRILLERTYDVE
jgi:RNA polymerase sigma-70 factor (ECF subfamily)